MSTIIYNNVEYNQIFIDPSKTVAGDGSTPENALFDFPTTLADNTCYVIRRTNESPNTLPQIPNGTYDFKNLMICGMPKETDLLYKYMNQLEKDAWGKDNFDYAMCRVNNTTANQPAVTLTAVNDFIVNRCYLFRDESDLSNDNVKEFAFDVTNADACTKFDNCKFGFLGDNFDDDAWLSSHSAPNNKNRAYFLHASDTQAVSISNCVFNAASDYNSLNGTYRSCLLTVEGTQNINICNNIFNICSKSNAASSASHVCCSYLYGNVCRNVNMSNNVFNMIDYGNIYCPHFSICFFMPENDYTTNFIVDNTKVNYKQMKDNVASCVQGSILFDFENLTHYSITNFDLDFSNSPYFGLYKDLLISCKYSRSPNNKIDNISIKYNTSSKVGYNDNNNNDFGSLAILCDSVMGSTGSKQSTPIYTPTICKATNISVLRGYGAALYSTGACIEANIIRGLIYLYSQNYFKANKVINPKGNYRVIDMSSAACCSTVSIDTLEVVKDDATYPYDSSIEQIVFYNLEYGATNNVFINHCNALPFNLSMSTNKNSNARETSWVANDYNGLFIARNLSASAKSWGVTRAGTTAKASFKMETTVNDTNNELTLGCNPCTGFILTPSETGAKTITAYFGSSNSYTSFAGIGSKIWLEAFVPQTDGSVKVYNSIVQGSVEQDTSVWEGDSGVKPLKAVLPVDVQTTDDIEVKVHFHWYDSIGYTYLDPELHLD